MMKGEKTVTGPSVGEGAYGLKAIAAMAPSEALAGFGSGERGLSRTEARKRLKGHGPNAIATERKISWSERIFRNLKDPLVALLSAIAVVSLATSDYKTAGLIAIMLALSVGMRIVQESRADASAERLQEMVRVTATVVRGGADHEVAIRSIVPGDVVRLSSGDMVPADLRLLDSHDLYVSQASLTGESVPVPKEAGAGVPADATELELGNLLFMGTDVVSGIGTAVVVATGGSTRFGKLAAEVVGRREVTAFDKGVNRFTWLMIRFMLVMVPVVFVLNGVTKGNWLEAATFALAVAIGLTPELLPMIVTVNLSKGAIAMGRKKVVVKRLNSIQNLGAMDVLCTDKTGTLTEGRLELVRHIDPGGRESARVLDLACLNSSHQTGLKNVLDLSILRSCGDKAAKLAKRYAKLDEIPFDFERRRMSVVVGTRDGKRLLVTKGAVEGILEVSTRIEGGGEPIALDAKTRAAASAIALGMEGEGLRTIALAVRELGPDEGAAHPEVERKMTLVGFLAFLDPAKPTAERAVRGIGGLGIAVKILTGDNEPVARKICADVGLAVTGAMSGPELAAMGDAELAQTVERTNLFTRLDPGQKERVIRALQVKGHAVGFLGDGVNDAPALRTADVGISVNSAVDVAKESSDIILLEKSLSVLEDGVREGRRVFGNIDKYVKMAASSNFGNMLSVVGASVFLPFLPMLPIQIVVNNLLYDFSQAAIPTDQVDQEFLREPRRWRIASLERFILVMGPVSSIFDYLTFFALIALFGGWANPALFRTGWFVESLLTQTLVIHVIRTAKLPFLKSRASLPLTVTTLAVAAFGVGLTMSPYGAALGFVPLPSGYWPVLALALVGYMALAQVVKSWANRRFAGLAET